MFGFRFAIVGVVTLGTLAFTSATASAQFIAPAPFGGGSFGGSYIAPSGGIVTKQGFTNPWTGNTVINKQYFNPYTGVQANKQIFIPGGSTVSPWVTGFSPAVLPTPALFPPPVLVPQPVIGGVFAPRPGLALSFVFPR